MSSIDIARDIRMIAKKLLNPAVPQHWIHHFQSGLLTWGLKPCIDIVFNTNL